MGISVSSYYYKSNAKEKRRIADEILVKRIESIEEILPRSGYRTVRSILAREKPINHKRIQRVMRENLLIVRKKPSFKTSTTDSNHGFKKFDNLLIDYETTTINQVIVGDITAFDICGIIHYLASLMDLKSRLIVGSAISDRINTDLVLKAFMSAKIKRGSLEGCIHHTDSDSRYCSEIYTKAVLEAGMKISMCVGNAYENAHAESLNKTLKSQEINVSIYADKISAAESIGKFIEIYNTYRPHSALNGMSPEMYEKSLF